MILTNPQREIAIDRHRYRVVNCGRRFGKTTLAVEEIKGKALSKPSKIVYVAPTYQQARDIAWEILKKELQPIILQINESRLEIRVKTKDGDESIILLRGWESIETLRGQKIDFVVIDEIAQMRNFWVKWIEVIRPTLTDNKGEALFISTPKGFNHFYDLYNKEIEDGDFKSFHFSTYDNPYIPKEEIDKAKKEMTEDSFAQEYLADFRKTQGLVYKEFDRKKHLFGDDLFIRRQEYIAGIDFGFKNPCAIISIVKDNDGNYYVTDEFYKTGKTESEIAEYVAAMNYEKVYPDPESPSGIEELKRKFINVREVVKNKDSIKSGIEKVTELLKTGKLKINKKCVNLISELETYSYPDKKDFKNESENPIKENDHALDALRYAIMMHVPISQGKMMARHFYPKFK